MPRPRMPKTKNPAEVELRRVSTLCEAYWYSRLVATLARLLQMREKLTLGGNFFSDADHFTDASLEGFFELACFVDAGE